MRVTAIVLAAGRGSRMGTEVAKQYLLLKGKPVLYYSLQTMQDSPVIDDIILVVSEGDEEYCRKTVLEPYHLSKVSRIVEGGQERYDSVFCGLEAIEETNYVMIHDGARPFISNEMLERLWKSVQKTKASVLGVPVKDTIKKADESGKIIETPPREDLWQIQTPQAFEFSMIYQAYQRTIEDRRIPITDDASAAEAAFGIGAQIVEGSYRNIKITTPEDLKISESFL